MPTIAIPLGLLALVPFIWFGLAAVSSVPETAARSIVALMDYAALILTFAGGVHWGLGLAPDALRPSIRFAAGMAPLIVAWIALIFGQWTGPLTALSVLVLGYLLAIVVEHRASQMGLIPQRYLWLRWGMSAVALVMMVIVLVLRAVGQTIVF